uniref:AIP3 domain-containing protein n=1 Tax=Caenorhabditis tropicalis TaxID=1561998 RepID=A0A1I7TNJ2_9PELO
MPLFSWRPRILGGRKTPEPTQAVQITIAPEPPEIPEATASKPRNVRFDDVAAKRTNDNYLKDRTAADWATNNYGGEARVIGTVRPEKNITSTTGRTPQEEPINDWRYADDVKVRIDSMDNQRHQDSSHRFGPPPSRATSVLQSLREQKENLEYDERRREVSTLPSSYSSNRPEVYGTIQRFDTVSRTDSHLTSDSQTARHLDDMNVVFLQANDEVKRTLLPRNMHSMHQVKMSFVRTFPNVNRAFVEQPHVKIYIQEPTKGALFYELEDPGDIKNKSVLRLREKTTRVMSPVSYLDQPDYHSETEQDDGRRGIIPMMRPASAMAAPSVDYMNMIQKPPVYDIYSDPYNSDTSSHDSRSVTRSGSATPVIDRESRVRMETMERQLAGLSSLVHSALVSKGMSETTQRDMAELRREILSMHPDSARESSEEPASSLSDSISSHTAYQLSVFRNKLKETHNELRQLRSSAQVNAQTGNTLLREAGDKIGRLVSERMKGVPVASTTSMMEIPNREDSSLDKNSESQRNEHASRLADLLHSLTSFETNVEAVRGCVLSNQKKLRMSEVEDMTEKLTNIGRLAANLKTDFPPIQMAIEQQIKKDMERVVREEKFIRDQNVAVDQSLRRCKALANIMVTMKKLAMVQDPTIQRRKKGVERADSGAGTPTNGGTPRLPPKPSVSQSIAMQPAPIQSYSSHSAPPTPPAQHFQPSSIPPPPPPPPPPQIPLQQTQLTQSLQLAATSSPNIPSNVVKVAPLYEYKESPKSPVSVLDNVLEEVGDPGGVPRPPSRFSVQDVRQKFSKPPELPDQLRNLIEDVARRASPGPDQMNDRRQDLEERQERLAEKQRQLRSQFQQLQQLAPLP